MITIEKIKSYHEIVVCVFSTEEGRQQFIKNNNGSTYIEEQYLALVKTDLEL
jgi:hypothetical protein